MKSISIVVPVYNGSGTLEGLTARLSSVLPQISEQYELILIDDGSQDDSWKIIEDISNRYPWIVGIELMRNFGQHNAILCGIREANYEIIATMDDDCQHPPEELPLLLDRLDQGYDVIYGTPEDEQHGFLRNIASTITKLALQSVMGSEIARQVSAYRVFRTHLREAFQSYQGSFVSIDVLLTWGTNRFSAIPIKHEQRKIGHSNYTFRMLVRHAMNMMTGFSTLPLQFASLMGFSLTIFGFAVLIFVIGRYLIEGGSVPGFPFLASIIAIFSGAQLFALGIIGEYMARMHFRLMDKPSYTIQSRKENKRKA